MVSLQPNPFTTTPQTLVNYDYSDVESGLGYKVYYAMWTSVATGEPRLLSDQVEYSKEIVSVRTSAGSTAHGFALSPFNRQKIAKGIALFSCGVGGANTAASTVTARLYVEPGNNAISDLISAGQIVHTTTDPDKMILLPIPLTETVIKQGEYLRLIVTHTTPNAAATEIGHDPKGRAGTFIGTNATTIMTINVPFKTVS